MPLPKLERTAKTKAKAKATKGGRSGWEEYPAASMSDATGSDTDGPETAPTVTCGGATRADAIRHTGKKTDATLTVSIKAHM